jgi:hypothetical protein
MCIFAQPIRTFMPSLCSGEEITVLATLPKNGGEGAPGADFQPRIENHDFARAAMRMRSWRGSHFAERMRKPFIKGE